MGNRKGRPRKWSAEESRRGGQARARQIKEGDDLRRAHERGDLVAAPDGGDTDAPCAHLRSSKQAGADAAGIELEPLELVEVPPEQGPDDTLLALQKMDSNQRARLLAD